MSWTLGSYLRVEGRIATLSVIDEPLGWGFSVGLMMRGGS